MKNNKGFTLIELLAVLLVLAIILTITIYSVSGILNNAENSSSEIQLERLYDSARMYYLEEGIGLEYLSGYDDEVCVNVAYLIDHEYINKEKVIDPKTGDELTGAVIIEKTSGKEKYTYRSSSCGNSDCYTGHCGA